MPPVLHSTRNLTAEIRLSAASEDGLSEDLCDPTSATEIGIPDKENDNAAAVYCIVSVP